MNQSSRVSLLDRLRKLPKKQRIALSVVFAALFFALTANIVLVKDGIVAEPVLVTIPLHLIFLSVWVALGISQFRKIIKGDDEAKKRRLMSQRPTKP
jgi:hypothetical protein